MRVFEQDGGSEPPPRRTRKAMLVDSLQYFHHQIELQAGALRAVVVHSTGGYHCFHAFTRAHPPSQGWRGGIAVVVNSFYWIVAHLI